MTEMEQETDTYIEMQAVLLFSQVCYIPMEIHVSHAKSHYSSPTHIKTTHLLQTQVLTANKTPLEISQTY